MANTPSIIAFTKDWNDVPTCTTHILREMGKTVPVLWLNSIGMRKPQLSSGRDFRRILQRLTRAFHGAEQKENHLRVMSPLVLPKAQSRFSRTVNRHLLSWAINRELHDPDQSSRELWSFIPNVADYIGAFRETKVIYYGVDDWSKFPGIDRDWVLRCEQRFLERADVLFVSSRYLEARWRTVAGDRVHYMPHGVWHDTFAAALRPDLPIPADLQAIRSGGLQSSVSSLSPPVIGFYGNLYDWIDFELVDQLAAARPGWSFVMIGPERCDLSRWRQRRNVHFLGRREPEQLPAYCKGFNAAIIPYKLTDPRMESVNPVKLRELLAAGVPVVAADIPEVRGISPYVKTARSLDDFLTGLETFLSCNLDRAAISAERRVDDWPSRVREIRRIVDSA